MMYTQKVLYSNSKTSFCTTEKKYSRQVPLQKSTTYTDSQTCGQSLGSKLPYHSLSIVGDCR
uniref:Uncharacterized protein n=1 Tax=Anguilla anguilla TaxID=7936 RepID=A0A0E9TER0_ANGAN